ncbi:uncharacterized protein FRV6_15895 [Fusarium oxysporum]|uniref:Cupin 2 conserved barrel domain-containing protein n=1 Tax=Fusarium oxysporum TaxID=5507 RepID=A0A2H3TT47_FUSOX|nr:uncharacterized protein FRV6_15895 [Fusarium oxysporum]
MERIVLPPSVAGKSSTAKDPCIFESFAGDKVYVSGTPSFTILTSGGQAFPSPVPTHYYKHTHHDFLCIKGQLKVWLNDQCKILNPGDYASVAPPYFLRNHTGPSAVLGGTAVCPYVTGAESGNRYSLATLEGSNQFETQVLSGGIRFPDVDHCFFVSDGYLEATINDTDSSRIGPGEVAWLPAGTHFDIKPVSSYSKVFMYSQPGGLGDLVYAAGKDKPHTGLNCMIPDSPSPFDREKLSQYKSEFKFDLM